MVLNGCFALTPYSMKNLNVGMTRKEVRKIMGQPYSCAYGNGKEYDSYYLHRGVFDLFLDTNFPFVGFYPLRRTGKEHYVVYKKGKLVSYGKKELYSTSWGFKAPE
jgi:hypothetical protein